MQENKNATKTIRKAIKIKQFYELYKDNEKVSPLVTQCLSPSRTRKNLDFKPKELKKIKKLGIIRDIFFSIWRFS